MFDLQTGMIWFDRAGMVAGETNRNTNLVHGSAIARVYSPAGVTVTEVAVNLHAVLVECSDGRLIGECANEGAVSQVPPEPLLTTSPHVGEDFTINSLITRPDGVRFTFQTRYWTEEMGQNLDGFTDCTITALLENTDRPAFMTAYNQVFCDGEIAELWYGPVAGDDSVQLIWAKRVSTGRNPL